MIFKKKQDAAVQQTAAGEAKPAVKSGKAAAFFRKNWKWMVPVVCVAVLGGWFILRPDKAQNANKDINYVQVSPSKRDVSNTLSGTRIGARDVAGSSSAGDTFSSLATIPLTSFAQVCP